MLDFSAALVRAGNNLAIEWVKLEKLGIDPAEVCPSADVPDEILPFVRARSEFLELGAKCAEHSMAVAHRYRYFLAGGCKTNPGFSVPFMGLLALLIIIAVVLLSMVVSTSGSTYTVPAILALNVGILIHCWDRVWQYVGYLKALLSPQSAK
jgi:hypothetical protein